MPLDASQLTRVGGQIGTNPAGIYVSKYGQRYYIKTLESPMLARNEYIAAKLYELAGVPVLNYVETIDPCQVATHWVKLDKKHISHFNTCEIRQAQSWFGVHAWTANWDSIGFEGDNQGVKDEQVMTLDVGGALAFRACGDPKGKAFGREVDELDSLRKDRNNPHAVKLFAGMTINEIKQAIEVVISIPDHQISQEIINNGGSQKLVDKMLARKANMLMRLAHL